LFEVVEYVEIEYFVLEIYSMVAEIGNHSLNIVFHLTHVYTKLFCKKAALTLLSPNSCRLKIHCFMCIFFNST